jgi:hypothetical protein
MKIWKTGAILAAFTFCAPAFAQSVHVDGYTKRDGTYVAPHWRSAPNTTTQDNWTTRGNVNPYTGVEGTRSPEPTYQPRTYQPASPYERKSAPCYYTCPK